MRLLLDTHVLIWWLSDDPHLGPKPRTIIAESMGEVLFSVVSCWEASLQCRVGKLDICGSDLWHLAINQSFKPIGLASTHIEALDRLPKVAGHRDPFDHLLLAQAVAERAALVTHDRTMSLYGIRCIGVR